MAGWCGSGGGGGSGYCDATLCRNIVYSVASSFGDTSIPFAGFYGCSALTSVTVAGGVTSIRSYASMDVLPAPAG